MRTATDTLRPARALEALPMVEAWRGVAAALVVLAHWGGAAGWRDPVTAFAFTGVDLFFVISGFVFAPYVAGCAELKVWAFAVRRLMRLWPAYLVALALYAALAWASGRPLVYLPEHVTMTHVQSREVAFYYNPAFWSLPAEVEFYGLVAVLALCLSASARQRSWPWLLAVALAVRLGLMPAADAQAQNVAYVLIHHLPGLLVEFLLGVWAWRWHSGANDLVPGEAHTQSGPDGRSWLGLVLGLAGMAGCTAAYSGLNHGPGGAAWIHGQLGLAMAACFAPVLAVTAGLQPGAALTRGACAWAGRLSYPVYLLHSALTPLASGAAVWAVFSDPGGATLPPLLPALAALLLASVTLHLLVEEPARRMGRAWGQRLDRR